MVPLLATKRSSEAKWLVPYAEEEKYDRRSNRAGRWVGPIYFSGVLSKWKLFNDLN